jgi:GNAT superfamily N-acetyltransferase
MKLREAEMDDAMGIAVVHVRSWQAAYRGLLPQDFLDGLDPVCRCAMWKRILSSPGPRDHTVVAEDAGEVVGFANVCPSRDDDATAATVGELTSIYLLSSVWGQGVGRQVMDGAVSSLVEDDFAEATLWVLEGNARARRFYEAGGWSPDGAVKEDIIRGSTIREVRYRRALP